MSLILLGLIQGLTEFLPVSSSGHLVLAKYFLNLPLPGASFEAFLHLASVLAVIIMFKEEIMKLLKSFFSSIQQLFIGEKFSIILMKDRYSKLAWFLIISTIPTALIGYNLEKYIELLFDNILVIPLMLFITGTLLRFSDKHYRKGNKNISNINVRDALFIGLAQAVAIIPGISRSGLTVMAGMQRGLEREFAAKYSFMLSIPIILGAAFFKFEDLGSLNLDFNCLILPGIVTFTSSYWAMRIFIRLLVNQKVSFLSCYLWVLALFTFPLILLKGV